LVEFLISHSEEVVQEWIELIDNFEQNWTTTWSTGSTCGHGAVHVVALDA